MLPRVLLQHLQTPRPINHSCHRLSNRERHFPFQAMQHTAITTDDATSAKTKTGQSLRRLRGTRPRMNGLTGSVGLVMGGVLSL